MVAQDIKKSKTKRYVRERKKYYSERRSLAISTVKLNGSDQNANNLINIDLSDA